MKEKLVKIINNYGKLSKFLDKALRSDARKFKQVWGV